MMGSSQPSPELEAPKWPRHAAVIGAAGGLDQGVLRARLAQGVGVAAFVRSRPQRIAPPPAGSRTAVVPTLADAVISPVGITRASDDRSALMSEPSPTPEAATLSAQVDRLLLINTLVAAAPGEPASVMIRLFSQSVFRSNRIGKPP